MAQTKKKAGGNATMWHTRVYINVSPVWPNPFSLRRGGSILAQCLAAD